MTREEAIEWINSLVETMINETHGLFPDPEYRDEVYEALDTAIKALKQEPILDKIRAELIQSIQNGVLKIENGNEELFRIIDKCKAESEE